MSVESEIRAALVAYAPLLAVVPAARISVDALPEGTPMPYIAFSKQGEQRDFRCWQDAGEADDEQAGQGELETAEQGEQSEIVNRCLQGPGQRERRQCRQEGADPDRRQHVLRLARHIGLRVAAAVADVLQGREVHRGRERHGERHQGAGQRDPARRIGAEHPGDAGARDRDRDPGARRQAVVQEGAREHRGLDQPLQVDRGRIALAAQEADGAWDEKGSGKCPGTCFALLFLKRATAPITPR